MLHTLATVFLLGMIAAFAVCAVLLNEGQHASRRRMRRRRATEPTGEAAVPFTESAEVGVPSTNDRRLAVGDFLFGALYLRGSEPLPFSQLADVAAGSGMSVAQVLAWIDQAEAGGLIERVDDDEADESSRRPAVRLTGEGMDVARNSRRHERQAQGRDAAAAARTLES